MSAADPHSSNQSIPAILRKLVDASRSRLEQLRKDHTLADLMSVSGAHPKRSLVDALGSRAPAIIAEVKKASPSKGVFRDDFDPVDLATRYSEGGAAAISVVTEHEHFQGDSAWIADIHSHVDVPILRKDFIIDELQIAETAAVGADAVLLIARILSPHELSHLSAVASECGLDVLYEAHDADDLTKIANVGARLVGINARNLDNFKVDTQSFLDLRDRIPPYALAVAESGLDGPQQIADLQKAGFSGFLVGESLIRSADPGALLRRLRGVA